jgi:hypothetical protein
MTALNRAMRGPENRGKRATDSAPRHFRRLAHRQSSAHLRPADEVIRSERFLTRCLTTPDIDQALLIASLSGTKYTRIREVR